MGMKMTKSQIENLELMFEFDGNDAGMMTRERFEIGLNKMYEEKVAPLLEQAKNEPREEQKEELSYTVAY